MELPRIFIAENPSEIADFLAGWKMEAQKNGLKLSFHLFPCDSFDIDYGKTDTALFEDIEEKFVKMKTNFGAKSVMIKVFEKDE